MKAAGEGPILVLNCGSSSIRFALFDTPVPPAPCAPTWGGKVSGIGEAAAELLETSAAPRAIELDREHPHTAALEIIQARITARLGSRGVRAVAHRVVHGGGRYFEPTRVTAAVIAELRALIPLAPLHQPFPLKAMSLLATQDPALAQVACFDTAFHRTLPKVEQVLPLPYAAWQQGLRRYGFHGLSYQYMAHALPERYGPVSRGRTVVAHLGSGASLCGMHNLASVATTMGFSALDGLMMGTRTGSIDPGALLHLMDAWHLSPQALGRVLYEESGLLGVSGLSSEPRAILPHETDPGEAGERARLALALYVRRIVREVGALVAVLGGLDLLVFTAGVGENNAFVRERVCSELGYLRIQLDDAANARNSSVISGPDSRVLIGVEPTNEEWVAACEADQLLAHG